MAEGTKAHAGGMPEWTESLQACFSAARIDGLALERMPEEAKTPRVCLEAVMADGAALRFVPEGLKTAKLCREAVRRRGSALEFVPEALKTKSLCLEAAKSCGWALGFAPDAAKTKESCLAAVRSFPWAFSFVPDSLLSERICLAAARGGLSLKSVPERFRTDAVLRAAMAEDPAGAIALVPPSMLSAHFCAEACARAWEEDGSGRRAADVWRLVPDALKDDAAYLLGADGVRIPKG